MNDKILQFFNYVKINIIELANKELSNLEKKNKLDKAVEVYFLSLLASSKINFITKFVIEKVVVPYIPTITQAIYECIKVKIKGITK